MDNRTSPDPCDENRGSGTDLQIFDNGEFNLEITRVGDSFRVQAPGLARSLSFHSARDMLRTVPDDEKGWEIAPTLGGNQEMWHVTEPGFYRVLGQRQAARIKNNVRTKTSRYPTRTRGEQVSTSSRLTPAGEGWAWDRAVKRLNDFGSLHKPMGGAA